MKAQRDSDTQPLPEGIDEICDAFEAAWVLGEEPRIEDFLARYKGSERNVLLEELLLSEWALRERGGGSVDPRSYQARFPQAAELINKTWRRRQNTSVGKSLSDTEAALTGRTVSHFRIRRLLGSGGMGQVYLAEDVRLARHVALKMLAPEYTRDAKRLRRFEREARAASALNHPNIVTIHDIGESELGRFIVMELVAGVTLRESIRQSPTMDFVADIGRQIAEALEMAHTAGLVHRDIKPQNIMIRDDGYVKVLDFGLVRLVPLATDETRSLAVHSAHSPDSASDVLSQSGAIVGTASYMSPEQAQGQNISSASDMFSLGIVLYQLATGKHPFLADSIAGYLRSIVIDSPVPPSQIKPDVPQGLDAVILRLLEKDPRDRPSAADVRRILAPIVRQQAIEPIPVALPGGRRLIGRHNERRQLHRAYDGAAAGRGGMVCITGEPGIGKTTLAEDFLDELVRGGQAIHVCRGRCSERLESTEAYLPLLEALENLLQQDLQQKRRGAIAKAFRTLAPTWYVHVVPLSSADSSAARVREDIRDASQDRMKRELVALLGEISGTRPVVLFLDDLHWADTPTVELLTYLAAKFDAMHVLVVTTVRPTELMLAKHPFLRVKQELQSRGVCQEIQLPFLNRADVERYLALEFPHHLFPEEFVELVHKKTEGSPLFMVDLVRHLRERQMIAETEGRWRLARSISDFEGELPESVRSMIDRKIDQLDQADYKLLTAGSVQGDAFDAAVVAEAVGADPLDVEDKLEVLEKVHAFISRIGERELPDLTLTVRYRFVHALYRDAFYTALNPGRRAALSRAVANALLRMHGDKAVRIAGDLAILYLAAREFDRACRFFVQAAENAIGRVAPRQAADLFTEAIDIAKRLRQSSRLTELQARRGMARYRAEMWKEARADLESALFGLGPEHGTLRAEVLVDLAMTCFFLTDSSGASRYGRQALELAEEAERNDLAAVAQLAISKAEISAGRHDTCLAHCERALVLNPANRAPQEQLGRVLYWMGRPEEAIEHSRQAAGWCHQAGHILTARMALCDLGLSLTAAARYREALEALDEAERLGREYNISRRMARAVVIRGGLHLHVFDFTTAQGLAEEARELARSVDPVVSAGLDLLFNFTRRHEVELAERLVEELRDGVRKGVGIHGWLWRLRFAQVQAELALARGQWQAALQQADRAIQQSRSTGRVKYEVAGLESRAHALVGLGRKHEAIADARRAVELARPVGDPVMFLCSAVALLKLDGSDALAHEARQAVQQVTSALPDQSMRRSFEAAEPVQWLAGQI